MSENTSKHATNYKVIIHSFDDDYYHGAFVRTHSDNTNEFIANFTLDLDEYDEDDNLIYLEFNSNFNDDTAYAQTIFTDFEVNKQEKLESKLFEIISQSVKQIFHSVKRMGEVITLTVA